ncbi:hypothetical protein [Pleomorphomonas sp. T1.2MG-36]|nr:hypothetical protein [Pleomorphomonas sp. T1.2MG-36]
MSFDIMAVAELLATLFGIISALMIVCVPRNAPKAVRRVDIGGARQ